MKKRWHAFYPEDIPEEIEIPSISLYELLDRSAKDYPEQAAIIDDNQTISYQEFKEKVDCLAASLSQLGFKKGDRAALMFPNSAEYCVCYYAVLRLGGIVVQVNPMYQIGELEYLLENSRSSWFFSNYVQRGKMSEIKISQITKNIYTVNDEKDTLGEDEYSLYDLIERGHSKEVPEVSIAPKKDLAVLQYTGGTTGKSKGVMLTHFNLVANVYQSFIFTTNGLKRPGERVLAVSPFFHVYGMTSCLNLGVMRAAAIICMKRFDIDHFIDIMKEHKPTLFSGVPTMYIAIINHPEASPEILRSLKRCISGSAPMPVELMREFEEKTNSPIIEGYGLSECSPVSHRNPVGDHRKPGSIGIPLPNTEAKVVEQHNGEEEVPVGEVGELVIKGPQVMKGYWNNDEETSLALRNGWLYTGDLATMDSEGYFYIVGRKKDLIIASGYNIYPAEVEEVLYEHPAIKEVCVFGVPSSYRGETVKAVIVPRDNMSPGEEEIIEWCSTRLARYKIPKEIAFRSELPKTTVGKVLRRKLVDEEITKSKEQMNNP
ncbi:long-chain fatty acid--CoA ligase [Thalassorhabdus alkalitolerans]|uniref:Long-chain fatty acid--CoA ligase n=1 Tax=Thalassorhabdus alkalitolerans TaxID=2282697 RepID=A0ABW0YNJ9_9BACI